MLVTDFDESEFSNDRAFAELNFDDECAITELDFDDEIVRNHRQKAESNIPIPSTSGRLHRSTYANMPHAAPKLAVVDFKEPTSDFHDPSAAMGFGIRKSFIIGRGRTSRTSNKSKYHDRPKFK